MEPIRLRVFRFVAEELSFTRAAERLFLTQPAVPMQVKNLEEELGLRLFDRTGQRIALTPAGLILNDYVKRIAVLCSEAEQNLAALKGETRGRLALGASTTIAQYMLPRLAGEFIAAFPAIQLSIISGNTSDISRRRRGRILTSCNGEPNRDLEGVPMGLPAHQW